MPRRCMSWQRGVGALTNRLMEMGKVYLIGAGPGAADLITVRGAKLLSRAQVVLHDALIEPAMLDYAPHARKIAGSCVGTPGASEAHRRVMLAAAVPDLFNEDFGVRADAAREEAGEGSFAGGAKACRTLLADLRRDLRHACGGRSLPC